MKLRVAVTAGDATEMAASASQLGSCARISTTVVECPIGDLPAGAVSGVLVTRWDAKKALTTVTRTATAVLGVGKDKNPGDNTADAATVIEGPDLALTVGPPTPASPARDETFTVTANVANLRLGVPKTATVALAADASIRFVSGAVSGGQGTCKQTTAGAECALNADATYPLTATFTLRGTKTGSFNLVTVASADDDEDPSNDRPPDVAVQIEGADLALTLSAPPTAVTSGVETTFSATVRNDGPAAATAVRLTHSYDHQRLRFVSASPLGACANDAVAGETVCAIGALSATAPGHTQAFSLTYAGDDAGDVTSVFLAEEPGQTDPTPLNNTATASIRVDGADLGVTVTATPAAVARLSNLVFDATVTNHGPATARAITTTFTLPAEVDFVSATAGCARVSAVSPVVSCFSSAPLAAGAQLSYAVTAKAVTPTASATATVATTNDPGDNGTHPDAASVAAAIQSGDPDADGVPDAVEDGAPNGGDGDGDGVPDRDQPTVSSVASSRGDYVTLVTSAGTLRAVTLGVPPSPTPPGVAFPVGALSFEVAGLAPGASATVTLHFSAGVPAFAYWKYGAEAGTPAPHWYDFTFDGATGATRTGPRTLTLTLTDGGRGDDDLVANGVIVDPGAPALLRLVVDDAGSASDVSPGDGVCDAGGGACTLRAAIEESNAHPAAFYVAFTVPPAGGGPGAPIAIALEGAHVTAPLIIDGTTQPGYLDAPLVDVQTASPWRLEAGHSALRGLSTDALLLASTGGSCVTDSEVLGLEVDGVGGNVVRRSTVYGPVFTGVGATRNRFVDNDVPAGGLRLIDASDTEVRGNAIWQNSGQNGDGDGVTISGANAAGNVVAGNHLGLDRAGACTDFGADPTGPCRGGNAGWGVRVTAGAHDNLIGGESPRDANLISANGLGGVSLSGDARANTVAGNLFGTDIDGLAERHPVSGTYPLENGGPCVEVLDARDNVIGGATAAARNICAGRGVAVLGANSRDNRVGHNWIMLDARGDVPWVRLSLDDVLLVRDAVDTVVHDNVVPTVEITGAATGTRVTDNLIGTDPSGTRAFYADTSIPGTTRVWSRGLLVHGAAFDTLAQDNVISGSYLYGVDVWEHAAHTALVDNLIGVDVTGAAPLPNFKGGVHIDGRFGGSAADAVIEGNLIAANNPAGLFALDSDYPFPAVHVRGGAARAIVRGNTIGLTADGASPLGSPGHGIYASGAPEILIADNRVGACAGDGVRLDDTVSGLAIASTNAVITGNLVGTDALGLLDLGNGGHGIHVSVTSGARIGGVAAGEANVVANNGGAGIWIEGGGTGNTARNNRAWDNRWLGLDLSFLGPDPNDGFSASTNGGVDTPVLSAATTSSPDVATVAGTLQHAPATTYQVDLYLDAAPDPSAHGEGRTWLGAHAVTTDGAGAAAFSVDQPLGGAPGVFISATVTDPAGNTSEHSRYVWLDAAAPWTDAGVTLGHQADQDQSCVGGPINYSVAVDVLGPDPATDVVLAFTYPAGVSRSAFSAGVFSCTLGDPTVTCAAATLAPGTYHVFPYGTAGASAVGAPEASVTLSHSATDPNPANASATVVTRVGRADLGLSAVSGLPTAIGAPATVSATVTSGGLSACATLAEVVTTLPPGMSLAGSDPPGACVEGTAGAVTCAVGTLAPGASAALSLSVVSTASGEFELPLTATHPGPDDDATNDTATAVVVVAETIHDLATTIAAVPAEPELGAPFELRVGVANLGPSAAGDVVARAVLPAPLVLGDLVTSHGGCVFDDVEATVTCALGPLAAQAQADISLFVLSEHAVALNTTACAQALGEDRDPSDDCATGHSLIAPVDLVASVSASPDPVAVGAPLTVTVTVNNLGPTTAVAAGFRMTLQPNVTDRTFIDASGDALDCTVAHVADLGIDEATCVFGDVPPGEGLTADVVVTPIAGTSVVSTVRALSRSFETNPFNDVAGLVVGVTAGEPTGPCGVGRAVGTLLADVTESGATAGWGPSPDDFCFLDDCGPAVWALATDAARTGAASWHLPDLEGWAWVTLMTPPIDLTGSTGDVTAPEVSFWQRHEINQFENNEVRVTTDDGANWSNADFVEGGCTGCGITWRNSAWPAFNRARIDLSAYVGQTVRLGFTAPNGFNSAGGPGWWVDDLEVTACVPAAPAVDADLAVAVAGPGAALALAPLDYTITVTNAGPLDATGVVVDVAIDAGLSLAADGCTGADGALTCVVGDLGAEDSVAITLSGTATVNGSHEVSVTVAAAEPDPALGDNGDAVTTIVSGAELRADAQLVHLSETVSLIAGATAVEAYEVTNAGPEPAPLRFTLVAPAFVAATGGTASAGGCVVVDATLDCDLDVVASGATVDVTVTVEALDPGTGQLAATVIFGDGAHPELVDPVADNDAVATEVSVVAPAPAAGLAVALAATPQALLLGESATATATVTALGPDAAEDVVVALSVGGAAIVGPLEKTGFAGSCDDVTGTCALGALAAGEVVVISLPVTPSAVGSVGVTALVTTSTPDPEPGDDSATAEIVAVAPVADLGVRWVSPPAGVRRAEPFAVDATLDNGGPLTATAPTLEVSPSAGLVLVSGPPECVVTPILARCQAADLAAGAEQGFAFVAQATMTHATATATITARAATATPDAGVDDDVATAEITVTEGVADLALAGVSLTSSPRVGQPVTARFTVSHLAGDDAQASRLVVRLPLGGVPGAPDGNNANDVSAVPSDPDARCVVDATGADCELGAIATGALPQTVDVTFTPTAPGVGDVEGAVAAATSDDDLANNFATVALVVFLDCAAASCDDGDPCTVDTCDGLAGCGHAPVSDGVVCDDGDPCTVGDACLAGTCVGGGPDACDDGDPCTLDVCDAAEGGCVHTASPLACDDGDACTTPDVCDAAGACVGGPAPDCDDGDACTLDSCHGASGCVYQAAPGCCVDDGDCDDGDSCTSDSCDGESGDCVYVAVADETGCDADQSVCTDGDRCVGGACVAGEAIDCDDGDVCTVATCDPVDGCTAQEIDGCCRLDSDCPAAEAGSCQRAACDVATGVCGFAAEADGVPCDADGSLCTHEDACVAGACEAGAALTCDAGGACAEAACDPALGCVVTPIPGCCEVDADCPAATPCAVYLCDVQSGDCEPEAVVCEDERVCTTDACDPVLGCTHTLVAGCCEAAADCPEDGSPCTAASCDGGTGLCGQTPVSASCDDGDACTLGEACAGGVCVGGVARDCDDGDVCTADRCDALDGCAHDEVLGCCRVDADCADDDNPCARAACDAATGVCGQTAEADGLACDADGDACTVGDACDAGVCAAGPADACDDGDVCTEDGCDAVDGCWRVAIDGGGCGCAPATATTRCEGGDVVWLDGCGERGDTAVSCDDGDAATDDRCDEEATVCLHVPAGAEDCDVACAGAWATACEGGHVVWRDPCGVVAGIAAACASDDPCAASACDEGGGVCLLRPFAEGGCAPASGCDEVRALGCEGGDLVWRDGCGAALRLAASCDDGDPMTDDRCDEVAGACVFEPRGDDLPDRVCASGGGDASTGEPDIAEADTVAEELVDAGAEGGCAGCGVGGERRVPLGGILLAALTLAFLGRRERARRLSR